MMKKQSVSLNSTKHEFTNEDPLTGEAGAHPMGTGLGAALGGATAGAATDQYFVIRPTNDAGSSNRTERSVVDRLATMFMEELKNSVQGTPRSFALGPAC